MARFRVNPYQAKEIFNSLKENLREYQDAVMINTPDGIYRMDYNEAQDLYNRLDNLDGKQDDYLDDKAAARLTWGNTDIEFEAVDYGFSEDYSQLVDFFKGRDLYYSFDQMCSPEGIVDFTSNPRLARDVVLNVFYKGWRVKRLQDNYAKFGHKGETKFMFRYAYTGFCASTELYLQIISDSPIFYKRVDSSLPSVVVQTLSVDANTYSQVLDHVLRKHEGVHVDILQYLTVRYPHIIETKDGKKVVNSMSRTMAFLTFVLSKTNSPYIYKDGNALRLKDEFYDIFGHSREAIKQLEEIMVWGYLASTDYKDARVFLTSFIQNEQTLLKSHASKFPYAMALPYMAYQSTLARRFNISTKEGVSVEKFHKDLLKKYSPGQIDRYKKLVDVFDKAFNLLPNDKVFKARFAG